MQYDLTFDDLNCTQVYEKTSIVSNRLDWGSGVPISHVSNDIPNYLLI